MQQRQGALAAALQRPRVIAWSPAARTTTSCSLICVSRTSGSHRQAQAEASGWKPPNIITNKNMIPFDERKPTETSGLRLGTPALTTRGLGTGDMDTVAGLIHDALSAEGDDAKIAAVRDRVVEMCQSFPLSHD
jgi:glycine/serine hydroxymethyltransferase